ncbi:hypothetical protein, partial [Mesorhizobium japonicum]|uniref:hypothetical protein n=1 Tax=Mesorhizobium japonicum TaxID=2066070 RepID=UPI003B5A5116
FSLSFESPSFAPQGVTLVSSQPVVAGGDAVDVLMPSVAGGGVWPSLPGGGDGVPVVYGVDLYGPFASQPVESDSVPSDHVAGHTTVTVSGTAPVRVSLPVSAAGYYTFVVGVDRSAQSSDTQSYLPDPYVWQDKFGLVGESFMASPPPPSQTFAPQGATSVSDQVVKPGGSAVDVLTPS